MTFKRLIKRLLSLTPKSLFNFVFGFSFKKNSPEFDSSVLEKFNKDTGGSSIKETKANYEYKYDLQIVIPCFNARQYVKRCLDSVISQLTNYSFCLVLVNDGSTDDTLKILQSYQTDNIIIIDKINGGPSSARNEGLKNIYAKYLMFIDADDYLIDKNVIEKAIKAIKGVDCEGESTIVQFSHSNSLSKASKRSKQHPLLKECNPNELDGFAWGKIYSSSIFERIQFPESYWFEDTLLPTIIVPLAKKYYKSDLVIYYYQSNEMGITSLSKKSSKTLDTFYVTRTLLNDYDKLGLAKGNYYLYRFYIQTIVNCVRLSKYPLEIRTGVFYETTKMLKEHNIQELRQFKTLFRSLEKKQFNVYEKYCKYYSAIYMNLD